MILAVMATTKHPPQLMQKDYYNLDLNYQERLEKKQNAAALAAPPTVLFDSDIRDLKVTLPAGMTASNGSVKCYRSVTTKDDVTTEMNNVSALDIPAKEFASGRWHIELDWEGPDGKKYFWETTFFVS